MTLLFNFNSDYFTKTRQKTFKLKDKTKRKKSRTSVFDFLIFCF